MSAYQDRIQGRDRLLRVRRIRRIVQVVVGILAIVLLAGRLAEDGASLRPLYVPLEGIIEILLLIALAGLGVGLLFRFLEIRYASRDSQKHLMAKYAMERARTAAAFVIVVGALLLIPVAPEAAGGASTDPPMSISVASGDTQLVNFTNPDSFGITFARSVSISVYRGTILVEVYRGVTSEASTNISAVQEATLPIEPMGAARRAEWSIRIVNIGFGPASVQLTINRGVMPALFTAVPVLLLVYGFLNIAWWFVLRPIRERTRTAVYAGGVAPGVPQGERLFAEYATAPSAYPSDLYLPPPPAPPPPASRPEAPIPEPTPIAAVAPAPVASSAFGLPRHRPEPEPVRAPAAAPAPKTLPAFLERGEALANAGQISEALFAFEEALRLEPGSTTAWLGKARCLQRLDRSSEALDAFRHALVSDPRNETAHRAILALLRANRRWEECLEAVERALQYRPNDSGLLEVKGDVLGQLGRRPEALSAYEAAYALDPQNDILEEKIDEARVDVPGLLSRALIASASANFALALKLLDDVLEVDPANVNALIGKAVAYRRSGRPDEALNCLDLVLGIQPQSAAALLNKGHLLVERGKLEEALEVFDQLVSLTPGDGDAWTAQGDVLVKLGRDDEALRAYAEALKLDPGDEEIRTRVRELEEAHSIQADALQELYKVKGVGPAKAKALIDAGFRTMEDFGKATVEQLLAIRGITPKLAEDIVRHFRAALLASN